MVSIFGFCRQQVPCYLSKFLTFKCFFCHIFVMCCSFNAWMNLSAEYWSKSSWCSYTLQNLELLFIPFLTLLQREEPLIYVLHDQPSELHTIMMRFLKQSVVGEKTGKYMLSLDVDNLDNRLKHDREMEIGEPTSKTLKKLREKEQKMAIMDMCSFYRTVTRYLTRHLPRERGTTTTQNYKETITDNQTGLCMPDS